MHNKKKIKIIFTILSILFFIFYITNMAFATTNFNFNQFDNNKNAGADTVAQQIMGTGIQTIKIVAYAIAIIMLIYIGVKYMIAAPSERADLKKSLIIFVVGAILVFAAGTLLDIITDFAEKNGLA